VHLPGAHRFLFCLSNHNIAGITTSLLLPLFIISVCRTGRTAGIKARKLEQQGVAGTAESARNILVGGGKRAGFQSDLTFLKNAMGDGVHFCIEKGGSARANLLSQQPLNPQRKKRKLLDAAATRIGTTVTLLDKNENEEREQRRRQQEDDEREKQQQENGGDKMTDEDGVDRKNNDGTAGSNGTNGKKNGLPGTTGMDWLNNNISREGLDREMEKLRKKDREQEELLRAAVAEEKDAIQNQTKVVVLSDYIDPALQNPSFFDENTRKVTFQSFYKKQIGRQANLLHLPEHNETAGNFSSPPKGPFVSSNSGVLDDQSIAWEDG